MQQFVVPQFIDVEDKIIGPLTTRQFIIILVAGLLTFLEYKLADISLFLLEALVTLGLGTMFAFVKVNSMPFHIFLLNIVQTLKRPKIRIWYKVWNDDELLAYIPQAPIALPKVAPTKNFISTSKLTELALEVDTGGAFKMEEDYSGGLPKDQV